MTRKIITALIVCGALALIALVYFTFLSDKKSTGNAFAVIPPDAAFVMHVSNPDQIQPYLAWFAEMSAHSVKVVDIEMNPIAGWSQEVRTLDSLSDLDEQWKKLLAHGYVLSSNVTGRADTWCLVIPLLDGNKATPELLGKWLGAAAGEKSFEGSKITSWSSKRFTSELHKCLVVSSTPSLAEQLVLDAKKDRVDKELDEAMALASADMPLHFYARMEGLGWLELDPLFAQDSRKLSGYLVLADTVRHPLQLIQDGGEKRIASKLPVNTAMLYAQSSDDFASSWNKVETYFAGTPSSDYWSQSWIAFGDSCSCDVNAAVFDWRGNEWGCAIVGDSLFESVAYYAVKDSLRLSRQMFPVLVDTFNTEKIFSLRNMDLFNRNQTNYLPVEHRFMTQVGDYAFFANNPDVLRKMKQVRDSSSLASTSTYRQFRSSMRTTNGLLYYQSTLTPSPFPAVVYYAFGADQMFAANIEPTDGHKCLVSIALTGGNTASADVQVATEVVADTLSVTNTNDRSWSVKNHTTGSMDLVSLSADNSLSWSTDGKVIWTKPLGETIVGDVKQVDLLRNGKLQLLFNTPSKLCAVDKNGNDVAGFPVALPAASSGEVSVFDYENNRNYRFVIPLSNGAVANLNSEGKPTEGWQYQSAGTAKAMLHVRTGGEDHLLAVLANGSLVDCKRNGLVKKNLSISLSDFDGQHLALFPGATFEESMIWFRTTNGTFSSAKLGAASSEIISGLNSLSDAAAQATAKGATVIRFK